MAGIDIELFTRKMISPNWSLGIPTTREAVFLKESLKVNTINKTSHSNVSLELVNKTLYHALEIATPVVWAPNQWHSIRMHDNLPDFIIDINDLHVRETELWIFPDTCGEMQFSNAKFGVEFFVVMHGYLTTDRLHVAAIGGQLGIPGNTPVPMSCYMKQIKTGTNYKDLDEVSKGIIRALLYRTQLIEPEIRERRQKSLRKTKKKQEKNFKNPRVIYLRKFKRGLHSDSCPSDKTLEWRVTVRGHWRNQAYGPKRSKRKPIFISEHFRGPDGAPIKPLRETLIKVDR